jgi:ribulose-5-phosphate 4-epimerase/fuculose-1-phosphate aldolase
VRDQIARYSAKLVAARAALPGQVAFAAKDDVVLAEGEPGLAWLARAVLERLSCLALVAARPSLPFADLLVARAPAEDLVIVPRDTETRTFLHDIPFLRARQPADRLVEELVRLLGARKGVIVEGVGIVASGALTVEQAFIHYSSVFHATFVRYLEDVLARGFLLPGEREVMHGFRHQWLRPLTAQGLAFRPGPLTKPDDILDEIATVGAYTVERELVDSFFGNISYRLDDRMFISQTASSLDELAGCIDPVPFDGSSTFGITASSELPAHRRIYQTSDARAILHGHPRFAVIMSMQCDVPGCQVRDCWRDCEQVRSVAGTPVVAGEIGAGGLARRVPPVIAGPGRAIVYGHGVFTLGRRDFAEAFRALVEVENACRDEYFRRLDATSP